jgi:hypothetical protein
MKHTLLLATAFVAPSLLSAQGPQPANPVVVPAPATTLPLKHAPQPTSAEISAKDLMTRLYIFADDSMQGREAGTIGNVKGTDYIAGEVKRLGLVPAGDSGTYFQTIPFKTRSIDPSSTFIAGSTPIALGSEWVAAANTSASKPDLQVVYAGVVGDSTAALTADQVAGKLVVFVLPQGPAMMRALRGGTRMPPTAAGMVIGAAPDMILNYFRRPSQFIDDPGTVQPGGTGPVLLATSAGTAKLFDTPLDQLKAGAAGKTVSLDVKMKIEPVPFPARNVVGIIPGSDPKLKGEYVAIGAHNDHIGLVGRPVDHDSIRIYNHLVRPGGAEDGGKQATPEQQAQINKDLAAWREAHPNSARLDSIANGADDDGTGSVSVLEVAEKMAALKTKPKRSTIFVWHVGEEKGLLGSAYFTDHPTVPRDSIVGQLNIDMVGRGDAWDVTGASKDGAPLHGSPNYLQIVGSRRLSTELGDFIEQVNRDGKHGFTFDYSMDANGHPMNIYCRSDHYEYARYGIPIAFFTTGGHSDYHQVTDEPQYIDYDHMARVDNLIEDIAVRLGNIDTRLKVDHPKPDPKGACQQ